MLSTRRTFLKHAAALAAAPYILPAAAPYVLPAAARGAEGTVAPSGRIGLGFIGIGAMGQGHLRVCLDYPEVQVLAVCDVDRWRRDTAKATVEGIYGSRQVAGYAGCAAYNDLRELLDRPDVDAVVIATGDRWHALATSLAAKAGKDIYCEKPAALTPREARAMIEVVHRYGRVFQTGLQQRSTAEFRRACDLVRGGALGKIRAVYVNHPGTVDDVDLPAEPVPDGLDWDLWLGPAPWHPYHSRFHPYGRPPFVVPWHFCRDFGGGNLTSNAVHALDVVQWGLGMDSSGPVRITPPETGEVPALTYTYAGGTICQVTGRLEAGKFPTPEGWNPATDLTPFGALFVGEGGWIHVGRGGFIQGHPAEVLQAPLSQAERARPSRPHHKDWFDAIRTRRPTACPADVGCRSTMVAHLGCIAHWMGRTLTWDPVREEFPGDEDANRWLARAMRSPWRL